MNQLIINTLRMLSIDQIEAANSGHPGLPMGAAPMAFTLWDKHLNFNPKKPDWINRDRFILSAGHGSALLYSLLHLYGYDVTIDDLKNFRQWGSKTPGHPEVGHTPGVEATTGPLGQGIGNGVGIALAEAHLGAKYNEKDLAIIDHYTYVLCSDGDLMEGVASEACSLAGHFKLGKLILLYDSNDISLDGDLKQSFSEDVIARFNSYGWQTIIVDDGNDVAAIDKAISEAKTNLDAPTLIEVKTTIGFGSPNRAGTSEAHGKPLGIDELDGVIKSYQWDRVSDFHVPETVKEYIARRDNKKYLEHNELSRKYNEKYPNKYQELTNTVSKGLVLTKFSDEQSALATREASGKALQELANLVPELLGGSADLASSNNTLMKNEKDLTSVDFAGRNIWFGVREHGMASIANGIALHSNLRPYVATFLVFSDYLRPSIRLAALSNLPVVYIFTHDSIAVGEDGPTHEPVEQVASLRLIPGLTVIRPADANETVLAWEYVINEATGPCALILSRQKLPVLSELAMTKENPISKGAYIVKDSFDIQGVFIASGSEVSLAIKAHEKLLTEGIATRVVSIPCKELYESQTDAYKNSVIPKNIPAKLVVEAGHPSGWESYGKVIGISKFGASAPGDKVLSEYGFNIENLVTKMKELIVRI